MSLSTACGVCHKATGARCCGEDLQRLVSEYEDRILPLDKAGARWAAQFRAQERRSGRTLDLGDALVAGTARAHDLALATRNIADFEHLDVDLVNPWDYA